MRVPVAAELLDLWEAGMAQPSWEWSVAVICCAFPDLDANAVNAMVIGERDARLLEIREALFGEQLSGCSVCEACGARVEMDLRTSHLRVDSAAVIEESDYLSGECRVHFRVPTAGDVGQAARTGDVQSMRQALLERCVIAVERAGRSVMLSELPNETLDAVVLRMSECDPQADMRFELRCPACGQSWSEAFDITSYLRSELETWAQRTLQDVHRLASAYGWREADVLAVSPARRSHYLEMIDG